MTETKKAKCPFCTYTLNGEIVNSCENHKWQNKTKVRYFTFHFKNLGYSFIEMSTGNVMNKLELWKRYYNRPRNYVLLTQGRHPDYVKINSERWLDGRFVGKSESERIELLVHEPIVSVKHFRRHG